VGRKDRCILGMILDCGENTRVKVFVPLSGLVHSLN